MKTFPSKLPIFALALALIVPTFAQQSADPSGACTVNSTASIIVAQTGAFYCVPTSVGAAAGTWTNIGPALNGVRVARAKYDFAVDGGAIATITPATNMTIPDNAIIFGVIANSTTALTSGGSATIAIGTSAGSSTTALKAATAVASYSADALLPGVPVFTAGTAVKLTAAGAITITNAVATLTAGVLEIFAFYIVPAA
jgi:hypothetical protein